MLRNSFLLRTKESLKANHNFDCNSKSLIYLMPCKVCGKQYVGSTTERFRYRWNNYSKDQGKAGRGEDYKKHFHEHFLSDNPNGLIDDKKLFLLIKLTYRTLPSSCELD